MKDMNELGDRLVKSLRTAVLQYDSIRGLGGTVEIKGRPYQAQVIVTSEEDLFIEKDEEG